MNDLARDHPEQPITDLPEPSLSDAFEAVLSSPNTASKEWVYRQYDHEVGNRTLRRPGGDAALLALHEMDDIALALSAGGNPSWTNTDPYRGAYATAIENATNLAVAGARPLGAVDCLNGGNPEKSDVYGAFAATVDGLADGCRDLSIPVVGGNVSLYNDSTSGPIPPTPTLAVLGVREGYDAPDCTATGDGDLVLVGGHEKALGGSEYLAQFDGSDTFPDVDSSSVEAVRDAATHESTLAVHDVSDGGLAVTLAEMVGENAGVEVSVPSVEALFSECPGRAVVETTDARALSEIIEVPVVELGSTVTLDNLQIAVGEQTVTYDHAELVEARDVLVRGLD